MAMEKLYTVRETHTRTITALGYNPVRREILMGCEDGVIKMWEAESGKLMQTTFEHRGWITDFLWWNDPKLMLSAANDGTIVAWGPGGGVYDRIDIGQPIYCFSLNTKNKQLVCGVNRGIRVYSLDEDQECGHVVNPRVAYITPSRDLKETGRSKDGGSNLEASRNQVYHDDIVRSLVCHESRIYSGGYDQKLIAYEGSVSSYTGEHVLKPVFVRNRAHDAGISCLILAKDNENNTWIMTGSFDKTVKIWSTEGDLVHILPNFLATISGICYVPWSKTVWVAGGTSYASLYDPKSGDKVSDFIGTFQNQEEEKYTLQVMRYFPETKQVVASTSRRHLVIWKYNTSGCITALRCKSPLETLAYTRKVPILIFSGDSDGVINKWERMQSNHFMYSKESYLLEDGKKKKKKKPQDMMFKDRQQLQLEEHILQQENKRKQQAAKATKSHYAYNKPMIPPVSVHKHPNTTILKLIFNEYSDTIVAACEDGNIYVWGFDLKAIDHLMQKMKPETTNSQPLVQKYAILLDKNSELLPNSNKRYIEDDEDSVTNRVAGFVPLHVLSEHLSCVTSMILVGREHGYDRSFLLSGGWDSRLIIWDLENGELHDTFRNTGQSADLEFAELACDGVITDMDYNPKDNEFAYASSDKSVYIRTFSTVGSEMSLVDTLKGHDMEITAVRWNSVNSTWVTGSEDGTVQIWGFKSSLGFHECEQVVNAQGSVSTLCIDINNGSIIAGVQEIIRVYDPEDYRLVQTNMGHSDSVRSIVHIKERNQYVSCSRDKTIRIWNAWKMPKKKIQSDSAQKKRHSFMEDMMESQAQNSQRGSIGGQGTALQEEEEEDLAEGFEEDEDMDQGTETPFGEENSADGGRTTADGAASEVTIPT